MSVGERIARILEEKDMSQREFVEKTGIPQSTVSEWNRKKTSPGADKIMKICEVLGVTPQELLQDVSENPQEPDRDYIVVSEGTEGYELLTEFENLPRRKKDRLLGYAHALTEN